MRYLPLKRDYCRTPPGVRGLKLTLLLTSSRVLGRTPPGVRGLKRKYVYLCTIKIKRRTPPGVRGLKRLKAIDNSFCIWSHPARGAWIETALNGKIDLTDGRTPPGVRGLKRQRVVQLFTAC